MHCLGDSDTANPNQSRIHKTHHTTPFEQSLTLARSHTPHSRCARFKWPNKIRVLIHPGYPRHPPNRILSISPSHTTTLKIHHLQQQRSLVVRRSSPSAACSTSRHPIAHRDLRVCCQTNTYSTWHCRSHLPRQRHFASHGRNLHKHYFVKVVATITFYKMPHHSIHFIH